MIARQSVWTDPDVKELAAKFIPAADEVGRLQSGKDAECQLFRKIAEQGHYAGRTRPSRTRQGTYATTADGTFLASWNKNDPRVVARNLPSWPLFGASLPVPSTRPERPPAVGCRWSWRDVAHSACEGGIST